MPARPDPETRKLLDELEIRVGQALLLSYQRVADILSIRRDTVANLVASGSLAARGVGLGRRVTVTSLRNYVAGMPSTDVRPRAAGVVVAPAVSASHLSSSNPSEGSEMSRKNANHPAGDSAARHNSSHESAPARRPNPSGGPAIRPVVDVMTGRWDRCPELAVEELIVTNHATGQTKRLFWQGAQFGPAPFGDRPMSREEGGSFGS